MKTIRVVAGAIIDHGRVLAALRGPGMSQAGLWELPGGKVESGEADRAALARELREELGVVVRVGDCLDSHSHAYPDKIVCLVAYACQLEDGTPTALEHAELRWVSADELDGLVWAPADIPLLLAVAAALLS